MDRPLYNTWHYMLARCYDPAHPKFKYYGALGVKVCNEWKYNYDAFEEWALANNWSHGMHISRYNDEGDYHPDNCSIIPKWENIHELFERRKRKNKKENKEKKVDMKKFKYSNVNIFDSQDLRVTINVVNSKKIPDKEIDLIYQTGEGIAINPSVFLVFGFKNGDGSYTSAYLSHPHMRNLKLVMSAVMEGMTDELGTYIEEASNEEFITNPFGGDHSRLSFSFADDKNIIIELISNDESIAGAALRFDMFAALENAISDINLVSAATEIGLVYLAATEREENNDYTPSSPVPKTKSRYVKPNQK
jgi:hypothetical protein